MRATHTISELAPNPTSLFHPFRIILHFRDRTKSHQSRGHETCKSKKTRNCRPNQDGDGSDDSVRRRLIRWPTSLSCTMSDFDRLGRWYAYGVGRVEDSVVNSHGREHDQIRIETEETMAYDDHRADGPLSLPCTASDLDRLETFYAFAWRLDSVVNADELMIRQW